MVKPQIPEAVIFEDFSFIGKPTVSGVENRFIEMNSCLYNHVFKHVACSVRAECGALYG